MLGSLVVLAHPGFSHAEDKAEDIFQADEEQPAETTLLTTSKDTPTEHTKTDENPGHQPEQDTLVQQDIDAKKKEQSEKLRLLKLKALESAQQKSKQLKKADKEDEEDIEILADNSAVGPVARTAGARLGAGHEDAAAKMSAKRRWDSREAHRIRKFVGISERGGSGAKRRRSSEGTPNKKGKVLTNEELMENIRQKTLNQELEFKTEVEELESMRKSKYHIPKPKTELSERIDPVEAAIKRAARQAELNTDIAADDEVDSEDDAEDEDWTGSADEEEGDESKPEKGSGSEQGSEEADENEKEKENHSSFSSNTTSNRPENTRKPLGEAVGHVYDNASDDSDGEVRGYRRIRRIINDDNDNEQSDAGENEAKLESPFADSLQPEYYMNEDGLLTQSKPSMEFADEDMQVVNTDEVKHGNQLRRRSYASDNDDEGYVARKPVRQPQQATQATQVTEATQAATQLPTQVETQQPSRLTPTQIEPISTVKEATQASASTSSNDSQQQQSRPQRSAFDTLKKGMKRQEEKEKRPIDPRYFEAQAEISDEDNLVGLISEDEDDDEGNNRQLEELVNDDKVARELREKQDKLATEKYQEQLREDDDLDKKVAQNAVDGRYRYRRRHRTEDGLELSSDDDDIDFMKAQEQLAARLAKKRRKQAGEEPMERYGGF